MLSSGAHTMAPKEGIQFDNLDGAKSYASWTAYGQSKFANLLFAKQLARRFSGTKRVANAVHPGVIKTNLGRHMNPVMGLAFGVFGPLVLKSIPEGAATETFVATHPSVAAISGKYFADCNEARPGRTPTTSRSPSGCGPSRRRSSPAWPDAPGRVCAAPRVPSAIQRGASRVRRIAATRDESRIRRPKGPTKMSETKEYKLNLPQTEFPMKGNLAQLEPKMLERWEKEGLFAQVLKKNAGKPLFVSTTVRPTPTAICTPATRSTRSSRTSSSSTATSPASSRTSCPAGIVTAFPSSRPPRSGCARRRSIAAPCRPTSSSRSAASTPLSTSGSSAPSSSGWACLAAGKSRT